MEPAIDQIQALLDALPDAVVIVDAEGNIEQLNAHAESLFGYVASELAGRPFSILVPAEHQQAHAHARNAMLGHAQAPGVIQCLDTCARRSDGAELAVEFVLTRFDARERARMLATARDASARRRAERALRGPTRLLEACFTHMLTHIAILDPVFNFIRVNDAYARATGYQASDFPGRNHFELFPSDAKAIFERVVSSREPFQTFARPFVHPTHPEWGVTYWDWTLVPILDDDGREIELLVFALEDVTERVRTAEELRHRDKQLMDAKQFEVTSQLAAGIAHDFNNVLTSVLFTLDLLKPEVADPSLLGIIGEASDIIHRAKTLTYQLLSFSRKQLLQPELIELNDAIRQRSTALRQLLPKGTQLRIVTCESGTCFVRVDPGQLDRVVLNLAANAADAMPDGGMLTVITAHIDIDAASASEYPGLSPDAYVMLSVQDNGIGMEKAVCERVFEPFFSTKSGKRNAGLGLSSVHGIVKQSGGEIFVHSKPGEGTTFKILFPRSGAPVLSKLSQDTSTASDSTRAKPTSILVVEDDAIIRKLIIAGLRPFGYVVEEARSGEDAWVFLSERADEIAVVLTDVVMSGIDGVALANRITQTYPHMPVVLMSGYAETTASELLEPRPFIPKPFSPNDIAAMLERVLAGPSE